MRRTTVVSAPLGQDFASIPESTIRSDNTSSICAKLVTVRDGRKEAVVLSISKPVTVGRDPERCSYLVTDTLISGVHCKLYAVRSPSGGAIISCQVDLIVYLTVLSFLYLSSMLSGSFQERDLYQWSTDKKNKYHSDGRRCT